MHNRSARILAATLLVLFVVSTSLNARILSQKKRGCPDGSIETFTLFEDDCTGDIYTLYVDCLGNTYFNVPEPQWKAAFQGADPMLDPFPERFWEMMSTADFITPGRSSGIYLISIRGEQVTFRNPYNQAEIAPYMQTCTSPHVN